MCGIAGIIDTRALEGERVDRVHRMMDALAHRGPDGEGMESDPSAGVVLGHRRLAIIDPNHGRQPMTTADGRMTIVFNGAIYNYLELRRELVAKGHPIQSYSDTEVLLYAYREWGSSCLDRLLGMFAFAIWDRQERILFCARDRVGIKPFYYVEEGGRFSFASEIKALTAAGMVTPAANPEAVRDYVTFQFCLGDKTLFRGVRLLEPGHCLTVHLRDGAPRLEGRRYWDVSYEIDTQHDESWFVDHLAALIEDATRLHLRSDVALGAHLSGGLDSSVLVCLAAELLKGERLNTFTGAFREGPQFDETAYAKLVAERAGADYHETYISGSDLPEVLPLLIYHMDEPVAGPGLIPQYYVSKLASEKVKVVLGGQGGDELFVGYARYLVAYLESCLAGAIYETADRGRFAVTLESIVPNLPLLATYKPMLQSLWSEGLFDKFDRRYFKLLDRSEGMAGLMGEQFSDQTYQPFASFQGLFNREGIHSLINRMTYFDLKASLPALLHVEDRTSMAVSIESRVPLLDHRIVEFMARVPPNIKFAGGKMKHLFKESVRNTVPREILERKDKMGFPTPLVAWTQGVARDFVHDTLLSTRARQRGLFDPAQVERVLADRNEFGRVVWGLLCLELWHRVHVDGDFALGS